MPAFICTTCGTQYAPSDKPPAACPICDDERQYVTPPGQGWTTLDTLAKRNMNAWRELEPNLISIVTMPAFGIGQRAQLLRTPHGNILWDCIALIDRATIEMIKAMGGIKGIAISHPHYYTTMVEWSQRVRRRADPSARGRPQMDHARRSRHRAVAGRDQGAAARA